jgi:hypothetical protein
MLQSTWRTGKRPSHIFRLIPTRQHCWHPLRRATTAATSCADEHGRQCFRGHKRRSQAVSLTVHFFELCSLLHAFGAFYLNGIHEQPLCEHYNTLPSTVRHPNDRSPVLQQTAQPRTGKSIRGDISRLESSVSLVPRDIPFAVCSKWWTKPPPCGWRAA